MQFKDSRPSLTQNPPILNQYPLITRKIKACFSPSQVSKAVTGLHFVFRAARDPGGVISVIARCNNPELLKPAPGMVPTFCKTPGSTGQPAIYAKVFSVSSPRQRCGLETFRALQGGFQSNSQRSSGILQGFLCGALRTEPAAKSSTSGKLFPRKRAARSPGLRHGTLSCSSPLSSSAGVCHPPPVLSPWPWAPCICSSGCRGGFSGRGVGCCPGRAGGQRASLE